MKQKIGIIGMGHIGIAAPISIAERHLIHEKDIDIVIINGVEANLLVGPEPLPIKQINIPIVEPIRYNDFSDGKEARRKRRFKERQNKKRAKGRK